MWGYLAEFWNAITQVGDYTIEWFQNVGNAVAGAIGNLFSFILHYANDWVVFFGWLHTILKEVIMTFLMPVIYVFTFFKAFLSTAFVNPTPFEFEWSSEVMSVFQALPLWDTFSVVIGLALSVLFVVFILKTLLRV